MENFEKYIEHLLEKLECTKSEKEDLQSELLDHLNLLKKEYMQKGYSEQNAIDMAINDFGDLQIISEELKNTVKPYNKFSRRFFCVCFFMYSLMAWFYLLNPFRSVARYIHHREEEGLMLPKDALANTIPFKTITMYIINFNHYNFDIWFNNIFGNMIVFMPFGFLLPFVINKGNSLGQNIKISFLVSSCIEVLQFIFRLGICDIDDIILNIIGSTIGFFLYKLFIKGLKIINKEKILG
ncbi:VanZ family protein [Inediibacterium massiliense]|uniref:VanZ family protein n=1 Tax=Inediibacterium massiliense TaxID=1658111 RepID=UPI0006B61DF3|nr:VanZ family protein [Inediibacterium massiliense]